MRGLRGPVSAQSRNAHTPQNLLLDQIIFKSQMNVCTTLLSRDKMKNLKNKYGSCTFSNSIVLKAGICIFYEIAVGWVAA